MNLRYGKEFYCHHIVSVCGRWKVGKKVLHWIEFGDRRLMGVRLKDASIPSDRQGNGGGQRRQTLELQLNDALNAPPSPAICTSSWTFLGSQALWFALYACPVGVPECQHSPRDAVEDFDTKVRLNIRFQISAFDIAVLVWVWTLLELWKTMQLTNSPYHIIIATSGITADSTHVDRLP